MKVLIAVFGTLGDLHPFMALGLGLQQRGVAVTIATSSLYREKILQAGLGYAPARPEIDPNDNESIGRATDLKQGPEFIISNIMAPAMPAMYSDLLQAAQGVDLVISSMLTFAAPMAAETLGKPWLASVLAPISFWSIHDMPVVPIYPALMAAMRQLGPSCNRWLVQLGKAQTQAWTRSVHELRQSLQLRPIENPLFEGQFSPFGNLALFSSVLGSPQPDWPVDTAQCGFCFYDKHDGVDELTPELENFLAAGTAPIVFTLGSIAVLAAGEFYPASAKALARLGARVVLLTGKDNLHRYQTLQTPEIFVTSYAPYSKLFPRASVIVHQGGVGTTAQAMYAGVPTIVVPHANDQPDNADRVRRSGSGLVLHRHRYSATAVAGKIRQLHADSRFLQHAKSLRAQLLQEDGVAAACDYIMGKLQTILSQSPGK